MHLNIIIKACAPLLSDEAALKLTWSAIRNVIAKWSGSRHDRESAMAQFTLP